jgi:hypothetical protein
MAASIPSRFAMSDWRLLYSTLVHGTLEDTLTLTLALNVGTWSQP